MKKSLFIEAIFALVLLSLFSACKKGNSDSKVQTGEESAEVVIYTYDSFVADWGAGPEIKKAFEEKTGIRATFVDCGDGVQLLSRAIIEKKNVQADVILGIDNNTAKKALDAEILDSYKPEDSDVLIGPNLRMLLGDGEFLTPYDYSHFSMIFDTRSGLPEPTSLLDLTKPEYRGKIILMDPRTSTPGLGFVAWTRAVFVDDAEFENFWKALKENVLVMAPGWSAGYGLFTSGEAPLVISYSTSPAANLEYDKIDCYKALDFAEGHFMQVEGAGILKDAPHKKAAEIFMDFLISEEAQEKLPITQWMYPANKNVSLPDCYKIAGKPKKTVSVDVDTLDRAVETVVSLMK